MKRKIIKSIIDSIQFMLMGFAAGLCTLRIIMSDPAKPVFVVLLVVISFIFIVYMIKSIFRQ